MFPTTTFDFYDDSGHLLRSRGGGATRIPDFVKTAAKVDQNFGNQSFALVVVNEGRAFKKYATYDPGNTWLSGIYFDETHDLLPPEAEKIAARNLLHAHSVYGLEPSATLLKCAGDIEGEWPPRSNLFTGDVTPQRTTRSKVQTSVYAIEKTASSARYPLNTPQHVEKANNYFIEKLAMFNGAQRWEFATNLQERASAFGIPTHEKVAHYAGRGFGPMLTQGFQARAAALREQENGEACSALMKIANDHKALQPAQMAEVLSNFDRETGLDAGWETTIPDPYETVYGGKEKVAEKVWEMGTLRLTERQLRDFTSRHHERLVDMLGVEVATPLMKDPVVVFDSLPLPLRETVTRMANDADSEY